MGENLKPDERSRKKDASVSALHFLSEIAGRTKINIMTLTLTHACQGFVGVAYALLLKEIINAAVAHSTPLFYRNVALFVSLIAFRMLLAAFNRYFQEFTRATLENRLKCRMLNCLLEKDYGNVESVHSGEWMNRLTADTRSVADEMTDLLPDFTGMAVRLIAAASAIVVMEPRFLGIICGGGITIFVASYLLRVKLKRLHKMVREADGKLRVYLQDILGSMLVVRSFGVEESVSDRASEKMENHKRARLSHRAFSNLCNTGMNLVMNAVNLLGVVYCGWGILHGTMSYGSFVAVVHLVGQIRGPVSDISGFVPRYYAMLVGAERLMDAESLPDRETEHSIPLEKILTVYRDSFAGFGLKNASFSYPPLAPLRVQHLFEEAEMPLVLKNVDLGVKKGEFVAFVGPTGCGKSTLLKLLMCLYPLDSGDRFIALKDEAGKISARALTAEWQRLFAYVPQGNHLMSGSVREIVAFSDPQAKHDDERVKEALTVACADEFVSELESGVDTILGERGLGISEGQMQRLSIARAIFSGCPILMLDECTSALDEATERRLLDNLRTMSDKTVLIVTHRRAVLEICDRILRFSHLGKVTEGESEGRANDGGRTDDRA